MSIRVDEFPAPSTARRKPRPFLRWRPEFVPKLFRRSPESTPPDDGYIRVGSARVNLKTGEVITGEGTSVLRPKTAAMLALLHERSGELVSKDEILEKIWPQTTIEEDGLVQCAGEIRRALGSERVLLRTHAKRGYSLRSRADAAAGTLPQAQSKLPWRASLVVGLILVTAAAVMAGRMAVMDRPPTASVEPPVVAVFPFEILAEDDRWNRIGRALTQDIIADLAQNSWLFVLADSATRNQEPSPAAASQLGADFFVSGTLQVEASSAKVTADLIDADTGRQVWSKTIEGTQHDVINLQQAASVALVGELSAQWNGPIPKAIRAEARKRGIEDLNAYELYLIASDREHSYTQEDLAASAAMLRRVVTMAPQFGEAWAKLSLTTYNMVTPDMSESEMERMWAAGHAAALEGYRVSPDNPHAIAQAANAVRWENPQKAERMVRRAAELAPSNADVLAYLSFRATHYPALATEAEQWVTRAFMLNPHPPDWYHWNYGAVLMVLGRYSDALKAFELSPDHIEVRANRVAALALSGDVPAARQALASILAEYPDFSVTWHKHAAGFEDSVGEIFGKGLRLAGATE